MHRLSLALSAAILTLSAGAGLAQATDSSTLTEEQIIERFQNQKTRGLAIAPAGGDTQAAAPTTGTQVATVQQVPDADQVFINISFDFDSAALREDQKPKLASLCSAMLSIDVEVFRILGHTDASGSADYNERLSKLRAEEVKRYLVSDCGLAPERLQAEGVGERFPADPDNPRADINRRVEFQVLG